MVGKLLEEYLEKYSNGAGKQKHQHDGNGSPVPLLRSLLCSCLIASSITGILFVVAIVSLNSLLRHLCFLVVHQRAQ